MEKYQQCADGGHACPCDCHVCLQWNYVCSSSARHWREYICSGLVTPQAAAEVFLVLGIRCSHTAAMPPPCCFFLSRGCCCNVRSWSWPQFWWARDTKALQVLLLSLNSGAFPSRGCMVATAFLWPRARTLWTDRGNQREARC